MIYFIMKKALFFYIVKTVCFEVTEMQTEFDINLTEKDMYRFSRSEERRVGKEC